MPRRLRRRTRRRLWQAAGVLSVLAAAGALWIGRSPHDPAASARHSAPRTPQASAATLSRSPGSATPTGFGTASGLNGFPFPLPASTRSNTPGPHEVVFEVTSDGKLGAIAYETRSGDRYLEHSVAAPMRFTTRVSGPGLLAVLAVQVAPDATTATCRIIIDGVAASVQTAHGPNRVVVCLA